MLGTQRFLVVLAVVFATGCSSAPAEKETQAVPKIDAAQQERDFKLLMANGIVTNVDTDQSPPRVFVGQAFYALDYKQREAAAKQVSDYWATLGGKPGGGARFEICDSHSGEKLYLWDYYELKR